ncbi:Aldo/keto reductase [Dacryopinax primogenitus]|uniref:Aldo/keto reductase n=1 Tax=Dacryopinax primogenitus (strain DJM 731) TaxID=1858805 RepID=M5GE23_DACPD|nr:Aldo/keto reductase [Dacryopinax primogenitus]EJU05017.1 Aldo/keto reductase [Dacryopinax primogenitus]
MAGGLPTHFKLYTGALIPSLGFGTWQAAKGQVGNAVAHALRTGYRHIDCAWDYGNEAEVGAAIRDSGIPRSELWITSKLWNGYHRPQDVAEKYHQTTKNLNAGYLDLYLIHWPVAFSLGPDGKPMDYPRDKDGNVLVDYALTDDYVSTWRGMEQLVDGSETAPRHIGISNFNIRKWKHLLSEAKTRPAVNQCEMNFAWPQPELVKWAKENGQQLEAYAPLGSGAKSKELLADPTVVEIATKNGVSPSRVLLSWQIQRGNVVLAKSVTPARIEDNFFLFKLAEEDFQKMEKMSAAYPNKARVVDPQWGGLDIFQDWKQ